MVYTLVLILLAAAPDPKLRALIEQAKKAAARNQGTGIPPDLVNTAKTIEQYEAAAVPLLLPWLDDPSPGVQLFAGYVLSHLRGLTDKELPALEDAGPEEKQRSKTTP